MKNITVEGLVKLYGMVPHPEGGYYKETYRAKGVIPQTALTQGHRGNRNYSTAIFYLLPEGCCSRLHRLKSDEIFHFYLGGPMTLVKIPPRGDLSLITMGHDILAGCQVQHVIEAGCWFGVYCNQGSPYSLIGQFPRARQVIEKLMAVN